MDKNIPHILSRAVIIDQGHILLCKTVDLPINFYFLPGGHVEHGESVSTALVREIYEETGAKDVVIKKFLGVLEYSFEPGYSSICHNHEYNFIFEVSSEELKVDNEIIQIEDHIEVLWMPLDSIADIDFRAEPLKDLVKKWLNLNCSDAFYSQIK